MFLTFKDVSWIGDWGVELGHKNDRYIEIDDELLERLGKSKFLAVFSTVLRQNKFKYIQERKRRPKNSREYSLRNLINLENDLKKVYIYNYNGVQKDFNKQKEIVKEYFENQSTATA